MGAPPRLIFCADGNPTHARIAYESGWLYGARLPARGLAPLPLHFADNDFKKPDRVRYMAALARHRPALAVVLDWQEPEQLPEVLSWAEEAAQYVTEAVCIVPKVPGGIPQLPRYIGGKETILAYSHASSYGASTVPLWELAGWPVHLLGGSPQKQYQTYSYLRGPCEVRSLDGNMAKKMATSRCLWWSRRKGATGHWNVLGGFDGNGHLEAIRRSLVNVAEAWEAWTE